MLILTPLFSLACSLGPVELDDEGKRSPLQWSVELEGEYGVGLLSWDHEYVVPVGESPRTIALNLWYPTEENDGEPGAYLQGLYEDPLVFRNADPAPAWRDKGFPVLVHSHGHYAWGASSASLMRFFASHGWVVVAPDHTDNTLLETVEPRPTSHYIHRPLDISASLNAIADLSIPGLGQVDTQSVLMSGHSFGAYTVWASAGAEVSADSLEETCLSLEEGQCTEAEQAIFLSGELSEPRIGAAITMAGAIRRNFFGETGHLGVDVPLMLMSGTEDGDGIPASWEGLQDLSPLYWLELIGGCHESFAMGVCSTLDPELGFSLVNAYSLALGRSVLLGDDSDEVLSLVSGDRSLSQSARYSVSSGSR